LADDTSVNSIEISCSNGKILKPNNGGDWGDWDIWRKCPEGSFICAMEVQLELNNAITFHSYFHNFASITCQAATKHV
jgi:hypothetical protein